VIFLNYLRKKYIFNSKIFGILASFLPVSILGIVCVPFDLMFAKLISIIFGNEFLKNDNVLNLYLFGDFRINSINTIYLLLIFGLTPVIIRAFLAFWILDISKNKATDIFQDLFKKLVHKDGKYINKIGDKKALGILTNHLNTFINLFITPIAQAFSSIVIAFLFILISIFIEPKASFLILTSTFLILFVLIKFTQNLRWLVTKNLGIFRSNQIGFVASALENNDLLKYAGENNHMTQKTFNIDSKLRVALKNAFFLSQSVKFFVEGSLPIAFIFITYEFINEGKTTDLLISLILILKSIPFLHQSITCISTAQLNQKSYYAVKGLLNDTYKKSLKQRDLNLAAYKEIIIDKLKISKYNIIYPKNIIKLQELNIIKGSSGSGKSIYLKAISSNLDIENVNFKLKTRNNKYKNLTELYSSTLYQSQYYRLLPLSVLENIKLFKKNASIFEIRQMMKLFNIYETKNLTNKQLLNLDLEEYPDYLSGGEIQRLCLVRNFLSNYPIILLDEPTSALDSKTTKIIINALKKMSYSKTLIVSTHESEFDKLASNIYEIVPRIL